jgi:long-chain acyl-CoA synthetase
MADSVAHLIQNSAERFADRPAVRAASTTQTYAELHSRTITLGARLADLGVEGARVGLLLPNLSVFPLALYGVLQAGATAVMLNPLDSPRGIAEYLSAAGARTVLTTSALAPRLPAGVRQILVDEMPTSLRVVNDNGDRLVPLDHADAHVPDARGGDHEAVIVFTAATGGWARGAVLSHANLLANLRSTIEAMQIQPTDRVVAMLPLIHLFGLTVTLNAPLAAGAAVIPVERFHPTRLLELLQEEQATVMSGVPAMYMALIAAAERKGVPSDTLRVAICGGAPLPAHVTRRWEELFGIPLREGYGLTEAGPVCLFNRVDRPNRPGTLGYPFPGVEVTIRDEAGNLLPQGEVGEICVSGANVFGGYLNEPGRSPSDFHGDALRTGDLGTEEPDGAIRFRGFLKPMFTRNGFNIYPRELERVLTEHPHIRAARVCALPELARENEIVLFVEPAPGTELTEDQVREICVARLALYKQPGRIFIETGGIGAVVPTLRP